MLNVIINQQILNSTKEMNEKNSKQKQKLVLVERLQNGTIQRTVLESFVHMPVSARANYTLHEEDSAKPPKDMVLRRKELDLIIEQDCETVAQIDGFYKPQTDASFTTDGATDAAASSGDIVRSSFERTSERDDNVKVWPEDNDYAICLFPPLGVHGNFGALTIAGIAAVWPSSGGGASQAIASLPAKAYQGILTDDYIANAKVFADLNGNGRYDAGEPLTTTDVNGHFELQLTSENVAIYAVGGVDTHSGVPVNMVYRTFGHAMTDANGTDIVISPLSTMISAIADTMAKDAGAAVSQTTLADAAAILAKSLGLVLEDPATLLNKDPVSAAIAADATSHDLDVLAVNRQLAVVLSSSGALVNGADASRSGTGTLVAQTALADILISKADQNALFRLTDTTDVKTMIQSTMDTSNTVGLTTDLRASNAQDLATLSQVVTGFNSQIRTETIASPLSNQAIQTTVSAYDTLITVLSNSGTEAYTDRGGDISLSTTLDSFNTESSANVATFISNKISTQVAQDAVQQFGVQTEVDGFIRDYVPLGIQLPSLGLGKVVDKLYLDLSEIAAQTKGVVDLYLYNPLTQTYSVVTVPPAQVTNFPVNPADAGFLYIKATQLLDPTAKNLTGNDFATNQPYDGGKIEIPLTATWVNPDTQVNNTYQGTLYVVLKERLPYLMAEIQTYQDDVTGKTGNISNGGLTNDSLPALGGRLSAIPAGTVLSDYRADLYDNGNLVGTVTLVPGVNGGVPTWTYDYVASNATALTDGSHDFTIRVFYKGTLATSSTSYNVTVDTDAPAIPEIGQSDGKAVIGTAEAGSTVTIKDASGNVLGTTTTDSNGRWTWTSPNPLPNNSKLQVTATDPAGNTSPAPNPGNTSGPGWGTVVIGAPTQVVTITTVTDDTDPQTGLVSNGGYTNDRNLTIGGTVSAVLGTGEVLRVYARDANGVLIPLGNATLTGTNWTLPGDNTKPGLDDGSYTLVARVEKTVGADTIPGAISNTWGVKLDTGVPAQGITLVNVADDIPGVTGSIANTATTNDSRPDFTGSLTAALASNEVVAVYDTRVVNGQTQTIRLGTATVNGTNWSFTPSVALPDGEHNFVFAIEDLAGNKGLQTSNFNFKLDTIDDGVLSVQVDKTALVEGAAGNLQSLVYTITRTKSSTATSAGWSISGVDPADLADGSAMTGQLSFAAGQQTLYVTVAVKGDSQVEPDAALKFQLQNLDDNLKLSQSAGSATTIVTDDDALISVMAERVALVEGPNGAAQPVLFHIHRTNAMTSTTVDWTITGDVNPEDLIPGQALGGTVSFAAGATDLVITVFVLGDRAIEADEKLTLELSNPGNNAQIGVASATTTILNDDIGVSIEAVTSSTTEGGDLVFRVVRSDSSGPAGVKYRLLPTGKDAVDVTDFAASQDGLTDNAGLPSGLVSFAAGETEKLITLHTSSDVFYEANETFTLVLSNPSSGLSILQGVANGSIVNDDYQYDLTTVQPGAVLEGTTAEVGGIGNSQVFRVTRSGDLTQTSTLAYGISGYSDNTANTNDLYQSLVTSSVTFAPNSSEAFITVNFAGDQNLEGFENYKVTLDPNSALTNAEYVHRVATATINPDDTGVSIVAVDTQTFEDSGTPHVFSVYRTGYTGGSSVVHWAVAGATGSAASETDFTGGQLPEGTLSFAAGETVKQITVTPSADFNFETNESYDVVLTSSQPGVVLQQDRARGVILNDESGLSLVAVSMDPNEGNEGSSPSVSFTISRTGNIKTESVVTWTLSHDTTTAADFADGTAFTGTLTFAAGETSKLVSLPLTVDSLLEDDKNFHVNLVSQTANAQVLVGQLNGTIHNDDAVFALQPLSSVTEGNGGAKLVTMTVLRTGDLSSSDTVDWTVAPGSGSTLSLADFANNPAQFPSGSLVFAAGSGTQIISFSLNADSVVEPNEDLVVTLSNPIVGSTIDANAASQTVTVLNDDDRVSVTALDASKDEGGSGTTDFTFQVDREGFNKKTTIVAWSVAGQGTHAAAASDFVGYNGMPSGFVTLAEDVTSTLITVSVKAENLNEFDEGFTLSLGAPPAGTELGTSSANGLIVNDDTGLSIAATTTNLVEGDSGTQAHVFTITRSGVITGSTTVDWAVTGSGASPADTTDFETASSFPSGTVSFGPSETVKLITVSAQGDTTVESTEGFTVTLSNASSNADIQVSSADGGIVADDIGIAISAGQVSVVEGATGASQVVSFTVTRSGDLQTPAVVSWSVNDWGTSGHVGAADFQAGTATSGILTFAPGQTTLPINFTLKGDNALEADELLGLTITTTQGQTYITTATAQTQILNDDVELSLTADASSKDEGSTATTPFTFTITPTGVVSADAVVQWRVQSSAAQANDFASGQDALSNSGLPSGLVTFAKDQTVPVVITVDVVGDIGVESDELFNVVLASSAPNLAFSVNTASSTITNDDTAFAVQAVSASQSEGHSGSTPFVFMVQRLGVANGPATVNWAVTGSGDDPAVAADFVGGALPTGTVVFSGTQTSQLLTVLVSGDTVVEASEGFTVTISNVPNITGSTAAGVIQNDDQSFAASAANATLTEADSGTQDVVFTVARTGDTSGTATVGYTVTGSAGVQAADYVGTLPSGTLTFGPNTAQLFVTVQVKGDNQAEANDTYTLTLNAPSAGVLGTSTATTTVVDNDVSLTLSAPASANEGSTANQSTNFVFTVVRAGAVATQSTVVDWSVNGGDTNLADFAAGQDGLTTNFGLPSGRLSFAPGATTAFLTVAVAQDSQVEFDEVLRVQLQNPSTTNVELLTASATTTIKTDDSGYSIEAANASRAENADGGAATAYTFNVVRIGSAVSAVVNWSVTAPGSGDVVNAADFGGALPSGSLTFAATENIKTITVFATDDQLAEKDEKFTVTLNSVTPSATIATATATGTILNDDQNFGVTATASMVEGNNSTSPMTFTVTRSGVMSGTATVDYALTGGAGVTTDDYVGTLPTGTVTFAPNENAKVITLAIKGDTLAEANEVYTLSLSNPTGGATLVAGATSGSTTVTNDDTNYVLTAPADAYEGGSGTKPYVFTVTRTGVTSATGSVQWKLQSAAGLATSDFVGSQDALGSNNGLPSGTANFAANATVVNITINVQGDTTVESNEPLTVVLSNPVSGTIEGASGSATAQILTDDDSFAISGASTVWETATGSPTVVYTITRTGSMVGNKVIDWGITASAGSTFTAADDLAAGQAASGHITFGPTDATLFLTVAVKSDSVQEADESMKVALTTTDANSTFSTAYAETNIYNDDARFTVQPLVTSLTEGNSPGYTSDYVFIINRSGYLNQVDSVHWSINTGATNSVNATDIYGGSLPSGYLTFAVSETTKQITLKIAQDSTLESDETLRITLDTPTVISSPAPSTASGAEVDATNGSADGQIINDDAEFNITAGLASVTEGDSGASGPNVVYTITRTGYLNQTNTVNWSVSGTGTNPTNIYDFSNASLTGQLTFGTNVTVQTVTISVQGDTGVGSFEQDETFNFTLSGPTQGSSVGANGVKTTTILNDDTRLTLSVVNGDQAETTTAGGNTSYVYNVVRSGPNTGASSVNWAVNNYTTDAADFSGSTSGTLNFAAGATIASFTVYVKGDDIVENDESFYVQISGGSGWDEAVGQAGANSSAYQGSTIRRDEALFRIKPSEYDQYGWPNYGYYAGVNYLGAVFEGDANPDTNNPTAYTNYSVVVERTIAFAGPATVTWQVAGYQPVYSQEWYTDPLRVDAATSTDFVGNVLPSGTVTFADGQTYATINIQIATDNLGEMDEGFKVTLTGTSPGSSITPTNESGYQAGFVIIKNDDTSFSTGVSSVVEGNDIVFTVYRNDDQRGVDTVAYSWTVSGTEGTNEGNTNTATWYKLDVADLNGGLTASDGSIASYNSATKTFSGTLTFADGVTSMTVTVKTHDDVLTESWREQINSFVLSNPVNVANDGTGDAETPSLENPGSSTNSAYTWLYDNEPDPVLSVTTNKAVLWEGTNEGVSSLSQSNDGNTVTFTFTRTDITESANVRNGALNYPTVMMFELSGAYDGQQTEIKSFTNTNPVWIWNSGTSYDNKYYGLVTFAANEATRDVTLTFYGDSYYQTDKNLVVRVMTAQEAQTACDDGPSGLNGLTPNYGPANAVNFDAATQALASTLSASASVSLLNDDINLDVTEPDRSGYIGSTLGNFEGKSISFKVNREGLTSKEVVVSYAITGAAVTSGDITGTLTGMVTIAAGQSSTNVTLTNVTLVDDTVLENAEAFDIKLTGPNDNSLAITDATAGSTYATVRWDDYDTMRNAVADTSDSTTLTRYVYDNDSTYTITTSNNTITETDSGYVDVVYTITRSTTSAMFAQAYWKVIADGANPVTAADFWNGSLPSGNYAWLGGGTYGNGNTNSFQVTVQIKADMVYEPNEQYKVVVYQEAQHQGSTVVYSPEFASAVQTIQNDDTKISIADNSIAETDANQSLVFTVTRVGNLSVGASANWALASVSTDASDFTGSTSGVVSFAVNAGTAFITVTVVGDSTPENDETFQINLSNLVNINDTTTSDFQAIGTIQNDDSTFSISAGSAAVEGSGQVFTITRVKATAQNQIINWAVTGSTNEASSSDFASGFPTGAVTFSTTEVTKLVTITSAADTTTESDEAFTVTITEGTGAASGDITTATATGSILNNDVSFTVDPVAPSNRLEGNSGTTPFVFTVTRSGLLTGAASVDWAVNAGTALANDFNAGALPTGTVNFSNGVATAALTVLLAGDTTIEGDETFTVALSNAVANSADGKNVSAAASATITDDDSSIAISAVSASKAEGDSGTTPFVFQVVRTGYLGAVSTVQYTVSSTDPNFNSTDVPGLTGTLNLPANQATTFLTISVSGDLTPESNEPFTVTLSNATLGTTIGTASASGVIQADDVGMSLTAPADTLEGSAGTSSYTDMVFTVNRFGALSGTQVVNWNVAGYADATSTATSSTDFQATAGLITFNPNSTLQYITVKVVQDNVLEPDETFTLSLSSTNVQFSNSSERATILDDEVAFSVTTSAATVTEGTDLIGATTTDFTYTVTRNGSTSGTDSVSLTYGGTATSVSDYTSALPTSLTFAPGEVSKVLTVSVIQDDVTESNETFSVTLSSPSTGTFLVDAAKSVTTTILNDDSTLAITASSADKNEGQTGTTPYVFQVVRTGAIGTAASVDYTIAGSGGNAADLTAADFQSGLTGTLILSANVATSFLTLLVNGDRTPEADEAFTVTLSNPTPGVTVSTASANGIIQSDDVVFDVTAPTPSSQFEGGTGTTPFNFVVQRSGNLEDTQVLRWTIGGVPASSDNASADDFVGSVTTGLVTFAPNVTQSTITVAVQGDYTSEADENFRLSLTVDSATNPSYVTFNHSTADATIVNDEASYYITATHTGDLEGNAATDLVQHVFTVTRTGYLDMATTVQWSIDTANSTADATDFGLTAFPNLQTLSFDVSVASLLITVVSVGDTTVEPDETFAVKLSNASQGSNIIDGTAIGKVVSDDAAWTVSTHSIPSVEGDSTSNYVFKVVRTGSVQATSIDWAVAGSGGNAVDAADFVGTGFPGGNLVFGTSVMTRFITAQVVGDNTLENNESFQVTLSVPSGGNGLTNDLSNNTATATINNDDDVMSITALSADKAEGSTAIGAGLSNTPFTFTVTRTGSAAGNSTVGWQINHTDTDTTDFAQTSGVLTFGDTVSVMTLTVNVKTDRSVESDEAFTVSLLTPGAGSTIDPSYTSASGNIRNDDVGLAITATSQSSVTEGNAADPGVAEFTVTRTGDLSVVSTVNWNINLSGQTAVAADFSGGVLPSGVVTFGVSESVKTITVPLAGDGADEGNETYAVVLSGASSEANITTSTAVGTIVDDDDTLTVTTFLSSTDEGQEGGTSNYVFKVLRSAQNANSTGSVTVDWVAQGYGTHALNASEFAVSTGSVSMAQGVTEALLTVQVKGDALGEYDETFRVNLENASYGSTIAGNPATGVVLNDDPVVFLSSDAPSGLAEGSGGSETAFTFTVTRSGDITGTSTVDWKVEQTGTHSVTAIDFGGAYPSGQVVFGAGSTIQHITVTVLGDDVGEFDEDFQVTLSNPSNATILEGTAGSTILNDDAGIILRAVTTDATVIEGQTGQTTDVVFRVDRVGALAATTVNWAVIGDGDYQLGGADVVGGNATTGVLPTGTLTFANNVDHLLLTLSVLGDDVYGPDEGFKLVLSGNPNLITSEVSGRVINDDSLIGVQLPTPSQVEGNSGSTPYVFTLTRTGALSNAASVNWAVTANGAHPVSDNDFVGGVMPQGTVNFVQGQSVALVTVSVQGDTTVETDEGFVLSLSSSSGSGVSIDVTRASASATIVADDQGVLLFGVDADHAEGQAGTETLFTYQIIRTGNTSAEQVVHYDVSGAVDADDFVSALSGDISFAANQSNLLLTLVARGDSAVEADEAFALALSDGGQALGSAVNGIIRNDDSGISVAAVQSRMTEGAGAVFQVVATGLMAQTVVDWHVVIPASDASIESTDVSNLSGLLTFSASGGTQFLTVQTVDDAVVELDEVLAITLNATASGATLSNTAQASTVVQDNDVATTSANTLEGNDSADVLDGLGGADTLKGMGGDDVLVLHSDYTGVSGTLRSTVDGGTGVDTLYFDAAGATFDLSKINLQAVEKLDISGTGANKVVLGATHLAGLFNDVPHDAPTGWHQLMIQGDANDTVALTDFSDWAQQTSNGTTPITFTEGGVTYGVWNNDTAHAQLLIEMELAVEQKI